MLGALLGLWAVAPGPLGCGSDSGAGFDDAQSASGAGGSSTDATSTSASTGAGGAGGRAATSDECNALCEHVDNINCTPFGDCPAACAGSLGAPAECIDEFEVLLGCWVDNLQKFACTPIQVLSPYECHDEEVALQDCIAATAVAVPGCSGQVCNSSDNTCSCKTFCTSDELKSACTLVENTWTCSCFQNENLLGTCTQALDYCDNYEGCCAAYFGT